MMATVGQIEKKTQARVVALFRERLCYDYPPHGRVRVAAPLVVSDEAIRLAVIDKLGWIKRKRAAFETQPRQAAPVIG